MKIWGDKNTTVAASSSHNEAFASHYQQIQKDYV